MAKKVKVKVDLEDNTEVTIAQLKKLRASLKTVTAGSAEWDAINAKISDMELQIKSATKVSTDLGDTLAGLGGPLGVVGETIGKVKSATQSWGAALKATGIGLLVALIGNLVVAFSESEGAMKKFEPVLIMFEKTLNGLLGALEPVIDFVLELALKAMPMVTTAFKSAYSAVTAVLTSLGKMGKAIILITQGEWTKAWNTAKDSVVGFSDSFKDAQERFDEGYKKTSKTQKKNAEDATEAAEKVRQAALKEIDARYKLLNAELEINKARELSLVETEEAKAKIEQKYIKQSNSLKVKELGEKRALYNQDTDEYKGYTAEQIQANAELLNKQTEFKDEERKKAKEHRVALIEAEKKYKQEMYDLEATTEKEKLDVWLLQQTAEINQLAKNEKEKYDLVVALDADYQAKLNIINEKRRQEKLQAQAQADLDLAGSQQLSFADRLKAVTDRESLITKIHFENESAKTAFEKQNADARKQIAEEEKQAKIKSLASYADSLNQISNILGASTDAGKAAAIASTTISTYLAAQQAYTSQLVPGDPTSPFRAALAAGVAVASGLMNVQKILDVQTPLGGGNGGGVPSAPQYNAPIFNVVGTSGVNQIAQTIGKDQPPIKAYVVSQDVTTQQALDRNIIKSATLG